MAEQKNKNIVVFILRHFQEIMTDIVHDSWIIGGQMSKWVSEGVDRGQIYKLSFENYKYENQKFSGAGGGEYPDLCGQIIKKTCVVIPHLQRRKLFPAKFLARLWRTASRADYCLVEYKDKYIKCHKQLIQTLRTLLESHIVVCCCCILRLLLNRH